MTTNLTPTQTNLRSLVYIHHSWFRSLLFILLGVFLPLQDYESIFMWLVGGILILVGVGQLFSYHRWLASISIIFGSSLLAFTLAHNSSLLVMSMVVIAGWLAVNWIQVSPNLTSQAWALLVAIAIIELFLSLLFWPVNAPSQAIILTSFVFVFLELIANFDEDDFNWKKMSFSLGLSLLVIFSILVSAIWFGF